LKRQLEKRVFDSEGHLRGSIARAKLELKMEFLIRQLEQRPVFDAEGLADVHRQHWDGKTREANYKAVMANARVSKMM